MNLPSVSGSGVSRNCDRADASEMRTPQHTFGFLDLQAQQRKQARRSGTHVQFAAAAAAAAATVMLHAWRHALKAPNQGVWSSAHQSRADIRQPFRKWVVLHHCSLETSSRLQAFRYFTQVGNQKALETPPFSCEATEHFPVWYTVYALTTVGGELDPFLNTLVSLSGSSQIPKGRMKAHQLDRAQHHGDKI